MKKLRQMLVHLMGNRQLFRVIHLIEFIQNKNVHIILERLHTSPIQKLNNDLSPMQYRALSVLPSFIGSSSN